MKKAKILIIAESVVLVILLIALIYPWEKIGSGTETENLAPATLNDMIRVSAPLPNAEVTSPVIVRGMARGSWYFEASFPVVLVDWDGKIIAEGHADAKGDWMTTDFVPFEAKLEFAKPPIIISAPKNGQAGALILRKDNPSGLPQNDASIEIPVVFK